MTVYKNILLGLGSNLGDREMNLLLAIKKINEVAGLVRNVSGLYETAPWGKSDQPEFLNQVILIESVLAPDQLLLKLHAIEADLGRKRDVAWGPRTLDIDILYFGERIISETHITIPHPGIANRKFVLMPLCEVAPSFVHPILGKTSRQLLEVCDDVLAVKLFDPTGS